MANDTAMIYYKFGPKWFPIHIKHFDAVKHRLVSNGPIKVHDVEYNEQSPELEIALEKERFWQKLKDKG